MAKRHTKTNKNKTTPKASQRGKEEKDFMDKSFDGKEYNCQKSKPNDWRWYAQNEQLLRDSASLPYSWPVGTKLSMGSYADIVNKGSVPGIMAIYTSPSFGWSDNENSPINVAARNIYSFVRHANSGHANYDAIDEMIYLMAMDSAYSYIEYLKRIYGVMMTYSYTNRYYPKAMIQAMGVSFNDIQQNLADFRAYINTLAVKVGSMCIPASMSYMAKHMWMYQGYYLDSNHDKAQTYMFVPQGFFMYTFDQDNAGQLSFVPIQKRTGSLEPVIVDDTQLLKLSDLITYGERLINPILQSEDMNIMSGDILKAFGQGNLYMVSGVSDSYTVLPSYEMEVLDQIQNLTLIGEYDEDSAVLHQDAAKGYLVFEPVFTHPYAFSNSTLVHPGYNAYLSNKFINFQQGEVQPANTMEASRMTNIAHSVDKNNNTLEYHTIASEVANYATIFYFSEWSGVWNLTASRTLYHSVTAVIDTTSSASTVPVQVNLNQSGSPAVPGTLAQIPVVGIDAANISKEIMRVFLLAEQLTNFDRHPAIALNMGIVSASVNPNLDRIDLNYEVNVGFCPVGAETPTKPPILSATYKSTNLFPDTVTSVYTESPIYGEYNGVLMDIAYYTIVDEKNLKQMAEIALLSMFNVTQYGRVAG